MTKIDRCVWVGRATARRMARDGTTQTMVAEYEWDAELRAEVTRRRPAARSTTARCAGAQVRAAAGRHRGAAAGDPHAGRHPDRFQAGGPEASAGAAAVLADTEAMMADPALRELLVQQMIGATGDVFGPPTMRDVTPAPEALPDAPETPLDEETAEAVADKIVDDEVSGGGGFVPAEAGAEPFSEDEQAGVEDAFGDASGDEDVAIEREWLRKELAKGLGPKGTEAVTAAVADPALTVETARELRMSVVAHRNREANRNSEAAQGGQS